jgi:hypothetical protein
MLKVTIEIDNKFASGLSPIEYIKKYILKDIDNINKNYKSENSSAIITITSIIQK